MAATCDVCGKRPFFGKSVSHSHVRTSRRWDPNIQRVRALVDGAKHINLWGERVRVAARVHTIGGLSAHAGQDGLLQWYAGFERRPPVALVHGEPAAQEALAARLATDHGVRAVLPQRGQTLDLLGLGRSPRG